MGAVLDGCPAGVPLSIDVVQQALNRRRPGQSPLTTSRAETDTAELLSGVYEGKTLGTPIAVMVRNHDARSQDYAALAREDRPGHADAVWRERFKHVDPRGGGRTSGRETLSRVIGGAVAEAFLWRVAPSLTTVAWVSSVGDLEADVSREEARARPGAAPTRSQVDAHPTRCPDAKAAALMAERIAQAKRDGDSLGGTIDIVVSGAPVGLGEPVFGKLKARLAEALAGIGAVTGVMWGGSDVGLRLRQPGSSIHEMVDGARPSEGYGGIQGGLSNGAPIQLRVFFKPPATLGRHAREGRHDPCILPRAVPVVEAMVSLVLADAWLLAQARSHTT
jgi:chorismate synthase